MSGSGSGAALLMQFPTRVDRVCIRQQDRDKPPRHPNLLGSAITWLRSLRSSGCSDRHFPVDDRVAVILSAIEGNHPIQFRHSLEFERNLPWLRQRDRILDRKPILELIPVHHSQALRDVRTIAQK